MLLFIDAIMTITIYFGLWFSKIAKIIDLQLFTIKGGEKNKKTLCQVLVNYLPKYPTIIYCFNFICEESNDKYKTKVFGGYKSLLEVGCVKVLEIYCSLLGV